MSVIKIHRSLGLLSLLLLSLAFSASAQTNTIRVAVLDFESSRYERDLAQVDPDLNRKLTNKIESRLVSLGTYQMVERTKLDRILKEQNLANSGKVDPDTAAKLGRILGVDAIIYGSIDDFRVDGVPMTGAFDLNDVKVSVKVHYKLTNTTNGLLQISEEAFGESPQGKTAPTAAASTKKIGSKVSSLLGGMVNMNNRATNAARPERPDQKTITNHCQKLTEEAVDEMISSIVKRIQDGKKTAVVDNKLAGQVIRVSGTTVYVTGIGRDLVKPGDKLMVRRVASETVNGKTVSFTEKIGEIEVTEAQDTVIVGRFAPLGPNMSVQRGDQVTNQN